MPTTGHVAPVPEGRRTDAGRSRGPPRRSAKSPMRRTWPKIEMRVDDGHGPPPHAPPPRPTLPHPSRSVSRRREAWRTTRHHCNSCRLPRLPRNHRMMLVPNYHRPKRDPGIGIFAGEPIPKGHPCLGVHAGVRPGLRATRRSTACSGSARRSSCSIATSRSDAKASSCAATTPGTSTIPKTPNCGPGDHNSHGYVSAFALRDIAAGEELTFSIEEDEDALRKLGTYAELAKERGEFDAAPGPWRAWFAILALVIRTAPT